MGSHQKILKIDSALMIWQPIWRVLSQQGFDIFPGLAQGVYEQKPTPKALILSDKPYCVEQIDHLKQALRTALQIRQVVMDSLSTQDKIDSRFEWNYLGLASERKQYLASLETLFWQNQDHPLLLALNDYPRLLDQPWRVAAHLSQLDDLQWQVPSDFFSSKSIELVESINQILSNWEFNPFLIFTDQSSMQWKITIAKKTSISGFIVQENNMLKHRINFESLTDSEL